jgi:hypothetical protein
MAEIIREIGLELISPYPNMPCGMNPLVVMAVAHSLRNGHDAGYGPCKTKPLDVTFAEGRYWLEDGRHRWMAHWIAGLSTARCVVRTTS